MIKFQKGDQVYVKINWAGDNDCWVATTVIKETLKRVKVKALEIGRENIGDVYFAKSNVQLREELK
jgi:hypothetical protein|tara:strand:- start:264 stop:461 length:198 start_codon:yes stop_codon:yes gene_type:complete